MPSEGLWHTPYPHNSELGSESTVITTSLALPTESPRAHHKSQLYNILAGNQEIPQHWCMNPTALRPFLLVIYDPETSDERAGFAQSPCELTESLTI